MEALWGVSPVLIGGTFFLCLVIWILSDALSGGKPLELIVRVVRARTRVIIAFAKYVVTCEGPLRF
jgi:hypothetical protein